MKNTYILAIESSCDDTAAAIIKDDKIIANGVYTQKIHENYGGVVPELASRKHQEKIIPLITNTLDKAQIQLEDLSAIAFTRGPGLLGSLIVGVSFAKSLALSLDIPIIEVHHMKAHVLAHFIDDPMPSFPFLCLTVSGGHTQIIKITDYDEMEILGESLDDAVGEAFDKAGKMLGLPYPAGPHIDRLAKKGKVVFDFPKPNIAELDFSFSGIKTAFRYFLRDNVKKDADFIGNHMNDICASFQHSLVTILLDKLEKASEQTGIHEIAIAGGVSANTGLRKELEATASELQWKIYIPKFEYCTDNAAMIAIAAYFKYLKGDFSNHGIGPEARLTW